MSAAGACEAGPAPNQRRQGVGTRPEGAAAHHGITYELIPETYIASYMFRPNIVCYFHEDNTALIRVVKTGRNPTMRHLTRVHGVDISSMHEKFAADTWHIHYEKSEKMAADIYTKAFTNKVKWDQVRTLINVLDQNQLKRLKYTRVSRSVKA
mgnify:CR=1 FL=1